MNKKQILLAFLLFTLEYTSAQFTLIKNFQDSPSNFYIHNKKMYFSAEETGTNNTELWVYNSNEPISTTNPKIVKDLNDNPNQGSYPKNFISYNNKLFFSNNDHLFSYDDNLPVSTTNPKIIGNRGNGLIVYNGKLYYEETSSYPNSWLWVYNDNEAISSNNPKKLINNPQVNPSSLRFRFSSIVYNNKLYYCGSKSNNQDFELYVYDESLPISEGNPTMVSDINPGTDASTPHNFIIFQNKVFFTSDDGTGDELWSFNGSSNPIKVYDLDSSTYGGYFRNKTIYNNDLYFSAHNSLGIELWKYDGVNNPQLVADIYQGNNSSIPKNLTVYQNKLFFNADNGLNGRELWYYDNSIPTSQTNPKLIDVFNGTESGIDLQNDIISYNGNLYFSGRTNSDNIGLFLLNSNTLGTQESNLNTKIKIYPNPTSENIYIKNLEGNSNQIKIVNSIGQIIYEINNINAQKIIRLKNKGIYYIKIETTDNRIEVKKIIVK